VSGRPLGLTGAGNSNEVFQTSVWTSFGALFYEARSRGIGGFIEFLLRFGVFSFPLMFFYFLIVKRVADVVVVLSENRVRIGLYFAAAVLLLSFQDSSPALPMSLMMVVALYRFRHDLVSR